MKCISLTQPWATLVAIGAKRIETRSWATQYRGPLAIHAAKGISSIGGLDGFRGMCCSEPFMSALKPFVDLNEYDVNRLPRGAIVATARLFKVVPTDEMQGKWRVYYYGGKEWELTEQERAFGDYSLQRFAWLLADIKPLPEPIPAKGKLGLWEWYPPEGWTP